MATSDGPIRFSLSSGSEQFYINDQTGDIFLISNDGLASLPSSSEEFTWAFFPPIPIYQPPCCSLNKIQCKILYKNLKILLRLICCFSVYVNHGEANQASITVKVNPNDSIWFYLHFPLQWTVFENYISLAQVEGLTKEKVMVYEAETDFSINDLNDINNTVWFRILNSQPV